MTIVLSRISCNVIRQNIVGRWLINKFFENIFVTLNKKYEIYSLTYETKLSTAKNQALQRTKHNKEPLQWRVALKMFNDCRLSSFMQMG